MKSIAACILLIAQLGQVGQRYMVILSYEVNKNDIIKNFCINRDKPVSGCNGKCYLKKKLDKAAKEENAPNSNTRDNKNDIFFIEAKNIYAYFFAEENNTQYLNSKQSYTCKPLYGAVFHPPQFV